MPSNKNQHYVPRAHFKPFSSEGCGNLLIFITSRPERFRTLQFVVNVQKFTSMARMVNLMIYLKKWKAFMLLLSEGWRAMQPASTKETSKIFSCSRLCNSRELNLRLSGVKR